MSKNTVYESIMTGLNEAVEDADITEKDELEETCQRMNDALEKICKEDKVPYDLSFSIGYAAYNKNMKTIHLSSQSLL